MTRKQKKRLRRAGEQRQDREWLQWAATRGLEDACDYGSIRPFKGPTGQPKFFYSINGQRVFGNRVHAAHWLRITREIYPPGKFVFKVHLEGGR